MEILTLAAVAGITLIINILDLLGLLEQNEWIAKKLPRITLLLLAVLSLFMVVQYKNRFNELNEKVNTAEVKILEAVSHLQSVEVLRFKNIADVYNYLSNKIISAKDNINDITWGSRKGYRTEDERIAYNNYLKAMEKACQEKQITYREISSLADEHYFNRAMNLTKYYSYRLGYHNISNLKVPIMSFIIIDSREVIMGFYRVPTLSPEGEVYLSIKDPNVLSLFLDYYETLWSSSIILKEADQKNQLMIDSVKFFLKTSANLDTSTAVNTEKQ